MTKLRIFGFASILGFGLLNGITLAHADGGETDLETWDYLDAESVHDTEDGIDTETFSGVEFLNLEFDPALIDGAVLRPTFSRPPPPPPPPTCTVDDDRVCILFGLVCVGECTKTCCQESGRDHVLCSESPC